MIPIETLRRLTGELLRKTKADQVAWRRQPIRHGVAIYGDFYLQLPNSIVGVSRRRSDTAPDVMVFTLFNGKGEFIDRWEVLEGEADFDILAELHTEALRAATGWDKVLADLEQAVRSKELIGSP